MTPVRGALRITKLSEVFNFTDLLPKIGEALPVSGSHNINLTEETESLSGGDCGGSPMVFGRGLSERVASPE